jgi:hypothetical protein
MKPCIVTDKQQQTNLVVNYLFTGGRSARVCCECGRCRYYMICKQRFTYEYWSNQLVELLVFTVELYSSRKPKQLALKVCDLGNWYCFSKDPNDGESEGLVCREDNTTGFSLKEVVMLDGDIKDSPVRSVLAAKGVIHNVIDLDWVERHLQTQNIEGNHKK